MSELVEKIVGGRCFTEYDGVLYPERVQRGNAAAFIRPLAESYCVGRGLDIGASKWPLPGAVTIQDDKTENAYRLDRFADRELDFIFSSHSLEHLARWQVALKLWIRKLRIGGILFLYMPHKSMKLWVKGMPGVKHQWVPDHETIIPFLEANGMEIVEFNPWHDGFWGFHIVARRV